MFLSTGLKRVRLLGMGTHFFPKNLARGMLIRVGTFIRDTIVTKMAFLLDGVISNVVDRTVPEQFSSCQIDICG